MNQLRIFRVAPILLRGLLSVVLCVSAGSIAVAAPPAPETVTATTDSRTIDPAALALLQKAENVLFGLKSFQADCCVTMTFDPNPDGTRTPSFYQVATLAAAKPNKMRYDEWDTKGSIQSPLNPSEFTKILDTKRKMNALTSSGTFTVTPTLTTICNGFTQWSQLDAKYRVTHHSKPVDPDYISCNQEPWDGFWARSNSLYGDLQQEMQKPGSVLEVRKLEPERLNGELCNKVLTHVKTATYGVPMDYVTTWYISSKDGFVRRKIERNQRLDTSRPAYTRDTVVYNLRPNSLVAAPDKVFTYTAPNGVVKESERTIGLPLLTAGTPAPDFSATDRHKKPVKLSDLRGSVVVVDFWASWCGPCIASMPHTQAVAQKLQKEGLPVVLLAVDNSEERPAFEKWVAGHESEFSALRFVYADGAMYSLLDAKYHVSGIPTQYVIDASGIIRASFVGYGSPNGDLEAAVRAAATTAASSPVTKP